MSLNIAASLNNKRNTSVDIAPKHCPTCAKAAGQNPALYREGKGSPSHESQANEQLIEYGNAVHQQDDKLLHQCSSETLLLR